MDFRRAGPNLEGRIGKRNFNIVAGGVTVGGGAFEQKDFIQNSKLAEKGVKHVQTTPS